MLRRNAAGFHALLILVDGGLAAGLLVILSVARFGPEWLTHWQPILSEPGAFVAVYAVGWVTVLSVFGLYRLRARWSIRSEAWAVARACIVMAAMTLSLLFIFRLPDISRSYLIALFPTQWAVTVATRVVLRIVFERMRARGLNQRYVLVVGAGRRGLEFAAKLEGHRALGLRIRGFLDDRDETEIGPLPRGWRHLGRLDTVERLLHDEVIDEVAICLPFDDLSRIAAIASLCEEEGKIVRIPVDLLDRTFSSGRIEDLDGTPVYSMVSGPDRMAALLVKRLLDVVLAAVGLVLSSPILLGMALAITVRDGRPILFRQVRVGLHGRPFQVVKFRTMTTDAEARYQAILAGSTADPAGFKLANDPRVTPLGRILRRTSLDELPQLWNVLHGEMSLVGPRPAPPREVVGYDLWQRRRLSMKPGITGLWQVSARRSDSFDERASLDLSYIDRWSLWLDLQILIRTIPAAFAGR